MGKKTEKLKTFEQLGFLLINIYVSLASIVFIYSNTAKCSCDQSSHADNFNTPNSGIRCLCLVSHAIVVKEKKKKSN